MIENRDCLQKITGIEVPCRSKEIYPDGKCPLTTCKAKEVLEDLDKLVETVGYMAANFIGPKDADVMRVVFHRACPH